MVMTGEIATNEMIKKRHTKNLHQTLCLIDSICIVRKNVNVTTFTMITEIEEIVAKHCEADMDVPFIELAARLTHRELKLSLGEGHPEMLFDFN